MQDEPTPQGGDLRQAVSRKGSFLGTLRAVAWSFFGVRKKSGYDQDVSQLNPVHVIIAGVLGAVLFVLVLVLLVQWIVASGVATGG
ncbi:DUF2970 domain-containing protein [Roseateles sp. BYS180W]|uniref:DUF2970 domain-containing protein n=1 Tax=Roseateles rivi TaxID=3299028 RepID=A0ABW7FRH9_9BURK